MVSLLVDIENREMNLLIKSKYLSDELAYSSIRVNPPFYIKYTFLVLLPISSQFSRFILQFFKNKLLRN